jgi:hypothetical protein
VFTSWNRVLASLSELHLELAAAAWSAIRLGVPAAPLRVVLRDTERRLRRLAATAVDAGEAGNRERSPASLDAGSHAFVTARDALLALRREARGRMGAAILPAGSAAASAAWPSLQAVLDHSLRGAIALGRRDWPAAEAAAILEGAAAREHALPFPLADAALTHAAALHGRGVRWQAPLRHAATWLRERREGGALNLLVAGWAER